MDSIGVRELRQHTSRYLARVATGECLQVTDRGRPVALLVPPTGDSWDELVATGQVLAPDDDTDLVDEPPGDYGIDASAALASLRARER